MALSNSEVSFEEPSPDPMEEEEEEEAEEEEVQALYDALEKKLAMSLDDLIKMSKKDAASKGTGRRRRHHPRRRRPNKAPNAGNALHQGNDGRVKQYMDSRSTIRHGVLAQRRSIPATTEVPAVGGTYDAGKHSPYYAHSQSQQLHQRGSRRRRRERWHARHGPYAPNGTVQRQVKFFR